MSAKAFLLDQFRVLSFRSSKEFLNVCELENDFFVSCIVAGLLENLSEGYWKYLH